MGWALLIAGAIGTMAVGFEAQSLQPDWLDPEDDCIERFGPRGHWTVRPRVFPVGVTCVAGDGARFEYLDPADGRLLTALTAVTVLATLAGLALLVRGWAVRPGTGGDLSTVDTVPPFVGGRAVAHAALAWLVALVLTVVVIIVSLPTWFFAGYIAAVAAPLPFLALAAFLAAQIDRTVGPGRLVGRASLGARRRGLLVGAGGGLVAVGLFAVAAFTGVVPDGWAPAVLPLVPVPAGLLAAGQHAALSSRS
ncbi:hypothetical protein GCM10007977_007980 [Dactylosporangium sucinum]|uniref:Uncharacterized protein n=2 Tax=Dactylosporangium sucinum TaxID=1424081 RepID=A0A917T4R1_9ACTN|nr:hypothetical protein GCM10007977_007980 [Dactylosporangium sucinum]